MRQLPTRMKRPEAILVISAHWEEEAATLLGAQAPAMYYDYNGFPEAAYEITYPAPGNPDLADRIAALLKRYGIKPSIDRQRGFDHGLFIPLSLLYPQADIPALQLSLLRGLDPKAHIALGNALGELMSENILVIGSGFSFHNMNAFTRKTTIVPDPANDDFQNWLIDVCVHTPAQSERERRLMDWRRAPSARYCHPREEHLLPLHICCAMAGRAAEVIFDDFILGKRSLAFSW